MIWIVLIIQSEKSESDHGAVFEEDSINRQIIPYSFEPDYTEEELREQADATKVSVETYLLLATERLVSEWCSCDMCSNIEREPVNVCCRDSQIAVQKMDSEQCITLVDDFKVVCLHKVILETALGNWHIDHGEKRQLNNKNYRFAAYRQYIGYTGTVMRVECNLQKLSITKQPICSF